MILWVARAAGASLPFRTAWPSAAPSLLPRTAGLVAHSFGVIPALMRTAVGSLASANLVGALPASH